MNITGRDKRTLIIGAAAVAVLLVFAYVVFPLVRAWTGMGAELEPKLDRVEDLRGRVHGQDSLLARRNALVRSMGAFLGQPSGNGETPAEPAPESGPRDVGSAPPAEGGTSPEAPGKHEAGKPAAAKAPKAETGVSLAAYVERMAAKSNVKLTRVTPKKQVSGGRRTKSFVPVAVQVNLGADPQSLLALLHALEKGERFIRVDQLQLRRDIGKGDAIDATLDVMSYEVAGS